MLYLPVYEFLFKDTYNVYLRRGAHIYMHRRLVIIKLESGQIYKIEQWAKI